MPNEDVDPPIEHVVWGPLEEQIRVHVANIRRQLEDCGLAIMAVSATETSFGYCHTVGLTNHGHPELVLADDSAPAMFLLEAMAEWVREAPTNRVTTPTWTWADPWRSQQHTYDVRASNPDAPGLTIVEAVYGGAVAHTALLVDMLSCRCVLCAHQVIIDTDGNYLRDA